MAAPRSLHDKLLYECLPKMYRLATLLSYPLRYASILLLLPMHRCQYDYIPSSVSPPTSIPCLFTIVPPLILPGRPSGPLAPGLLPTRTLLSQYYVHAKRKALRTVKPDVTPPSDESEDPVSHLLSPPRLQHDSASSSLRQSPRSSIQYLPLLTDPMMSDDMQLPLDFFLPAPAYAQIVQREPPVVNRPSHLHHYELPAYSPYKHLELNVSTTGGERFSRMATTYEIGSWILLSRLPSNSSPDEILTALRKCPLLSLTNDVQYPIPSLSSLNECSALIRLEAPVMFAYPTNVASVSPRRVYPQIVRWNPPPSLGTRYYYRTKRATASTPSNRCWTDNCQCLTFSSVDMTTVCTCGHHDVQHAASDPLAPAEFSHLASPVPPAVLSPVIIQHLNVDAVDFLSHAPIWIVIVPTDFTLLHLFRAQLGAFLQLFTVGTKSPFTIVMRTASMRAYHRKTKKHLFFVQVYFHVYASQSVPDDLAQKISSAVTLVSPTDLKLRVLNGVPFLWSSSRDALDQFSASQGFIFSQLKIRRLRVYRPTTPNLNFFSIIKILSDHYLTFVPADSAQPPLEGYSLLPVVHNLAIPSLSLRWDPRARLLEYVSTEYFSILFDDDVPSFTNEFRAILCHAFQATMVNTQGNLNLWSLRDVLSTPEAELTDFVDSPSVEVLISLTLIAIQSAYYGSRVCPVRLNLPLQLTASSASSSLSQALLSASPSFSDDTDDDRVSQRITHQDHQIDEIRALLREQRFAQEQLLDSQTQFQSQMLAFIASQTK